MFKHSMVRIESIDGDKLPSIRKVKFKPIRTRSRWLECHPKSNEKYMPFSHCISSFEGTSYKNLLDTATRSFICCFYGFYINRYCFSQIFRTSFNIIWKKYFHHEFSFFNGFTQPPPLPPLHPLKLPKSHKHDKSFLLMLPNMKIAIIHIIHHIKSKMSDIRSFI